MENFLGRVREFFRNDDIVSAVTGEAVDPPFFDPKRKRYTQITTAVGYISLFAVMVFALDDAPRASDRSRRRTIFRTSFS